MCGILRFRRDRSCFPSCVFLTQTHTTDTFSLVLLSNAFRSLMPPRVVCMPKFARRLAVSLCCFPVLFYISLAFAYWIFSVLFIFCCCPLIPWLEETNCLDFFSSCRLITMIWFPTLICSICGATTGHGKAICNACQININMSYSKIMHMHLLECVSVCVCSCSGAFYRSLSPSLSRSFG